MWRKRSGSPEYKQVAALAAAILMEGPQDFRSLLDAVQAGLHLRRDVAAKWLIGYLGGARRAGKIERGDTNDGQMDVYSWLG